MTDSFLFPILYADICIWYHRQKYLFTKEYCSDASLWDIPRPETKEAPIVCLWDSLDPTHLVTGLWGEYRRHQPARRQKLINTLRLRHNGCHFADSIFKLIFLIEFVLFGVRFESLYLRVHLTQCQEWFRWWFGRKQATSHYLNQRWPRLQMHISITWP